MIVSSQVDLICWTGRVGLICRDCREALTTGDAGGARRVSKRAAIEGGHGMPSLQRFAPTIRGTHCQSAFKFGSDSLLIKFKRRLALVSQRNQHDAASPTSVGPGPSRV